MGTFRLSACSAGLAAELSRHGWLTLVYRNAVCPTQLDGENTRWDHTRAHGPITGTPTCSSTQPSLMAT